MRFFLKLSIITLLIVSCSSDSNNEDVQMPEAEEEENNDTEFVDNFDRSTMITEWADKIIIPNYDLFVDKLNFYNNNTAIIFGENHTVTSNDISFLRITFENIYFNSLLTDKKFKELLILE